MMRNKFVLNAVIGLLPGLGLFYLLLAHVLWLGSWPVDLTVLLIASIVAISYLWARRHVGLARTGLEWVLVALLGTVALSLAFSPDPRLGLERVAWLLGLALLFYLLVDAFALGLPRRAPLYGLMLVSGITAAMAVLETYVWYSGYWQGMGFGAQPPYPYRLVGLLGHPNFYMAFVNLCAPLAAVTFLRAGRFGLRFAAGLWLAFYALSVPFSSSRGGWVGLAVWLAALAGLWLLAGRRWARVLVWARRRIALVVGGGLVGLLLVGLAAYRFILIFAAHPSHGGSAFGGSGRFEFWAAAMRIWQDYVLTGAGPSRFMYEYLRVTDGFPPGFWAAHAHNFPLTWLAETGLLGELALLALIGVACWQLWRWYAACKPEQRAMAGALLAGLAGFAVQSVFDDFTGISLLMAAASLFAAWLVTAGSVPLARWRFPQIWLGLPLAAVLSVAAWSTWGGWPFWQARQAAEQGAWSEAADLAAHSAERDPAFVFYQVQAGLARARAWRETQRPEDLQSARGFLQAAVELEPAFSLAWANLGVLDWLAGDRAAAERHLQEAIRRSPGEPSYWLNLGALREENGDLSGAQEAYQRVIELSPGWASHPFWQQTAMRAQWQSQSVAQGAAQPGLEVVELAHWQAACVAVQVGQLDEARRQLSLSRAVGEDVMASLGCAGRLAEAEGHFEDARASYQTIEKLLAGEYLADNASLSDMYACFHRRAGLDLQVVPGYLALANNVGQFTGLEAFYELRVREEGCAEAFSTWEVWQRALRGGALEPLPAPDCRPTVMSVGDENR